jgi:lipoprotein-anchoring transpeptidase ErfK/SrfK
MAFRTALALIGLLIGLAAAPGVAVAQSGPPTLFPLWRPLPPPVPPQANDDEPTQLSPPGRGQRTVPVERDDVDPPYGPERRRTVYPIERDRDPYVPPAPGFADREPTPYTPRDYPDVDPRNHPYDRGNARVPPGPGQVPTARDYPPPQQPDPRYDPYRRQEADIPRPPGVVGPDQPTGAVRSPDPRTQMSALPPEVQPEVGEPKQLPPQFRRQLVDYQTREPAGTIIIDTPNTYLYLVLGKGKAMRYGIGVGREGFTWKGVERISKMAEWPDWHPPAEMIERQPYLPRFMAGGPGNPLGARALYLGKTLYRIHGTNQPSTIGTFVSSGCIRLVNEDVEDLYGRVKVGTRVIVLPGNPPSVTANAPVSLTPGTDRPPGPPGLPVVERAPPGVQNDALPPLMPPRR